MFEEIYSWFKVPGLIKIILVLIVYGLGCAWLGSRCGVKTTPKPGYPARSMRQLIREQEKRRRRSKDTRSFN